MKTGRSFLLVNSGDPRDRVGGARLRWEALAAGLRQIGQLNRFEPWCDRSCGQQHPESSEVPDPLAWMPSQDPFYEFYCPEQARRLQDSILQLQPDFVIGSGLEMARYISEASHLGCITAIDFKDVDSEVRKAMSRAVKEQNGYEAFHSEEYDHYLSQQTVHQLEELQHAALRSCDLVWTCTDRDQQILVAAFRLFAGKVQVVPNAVHVSEHTLPTSNVPLRVVFIGKLNYLPCVQASRFIIDELAPALKVDRPRLHIALVGAQPPEDILADAIRAGVEVVADPPDVSPYWERSILVVPLTIGSGSRLKIIEAFAHHCPVVTSAKGIEGIEATPGADYLQAESVTEFVKAIRQLRDDHALRNEITASALRYVRANNSIGNVTKAIESSIEALL
jgi:polysaccharide biosynthesis protein PslH